jgi:salicylate hydroxylase
VHNLLYCQCGCAHPHQYFDWEVTLSSDHLRVAIVGGGIGGLSAANALVRRGFDVTVFEQVETLREIGTGLSLFPNGRRQLERMGLKDALAQVGAKIGDVSIYRMDGSFVGAMPTTDSSGWYGVYGMHRADLSQTLAEALPTTVIRTGHCCIGFEQNAGAAQLKFANGTTVEADVVIGADGIQSFLQKYVVQPFAPEYSGSRAYRGVVAMERVPEWEKEVHRIWMGDGKHFMVYPVRRGELLNYVGFVPTEHETAESSAIGDRQQLAASFEGWDRRVVGLLKKVDTCFWWGLYDRGPLASWTKGRLALLGDAAHAMLPHLGQGANQAIEDAAALAIFLERRNRGEIVDTLRHYEAFRRERTNVVQAEARKMGLRYDSRYSDLGQRDQEITGAVKSFRMWLYDYDVEDAAIAYLGKI